MCVCVCVGEGLGGVINFFVTYLGRGGADSSTLCRLSLGVGAWVANFLLPIGLRGSENNV